MAIIPNTKKPLAESTGNNNSNAAGAVVTHRHGLAEFDSVLRQYFSTKSKRPHSAVDEPVSITDNCEQV